MEKIINEKIDEYIREICEKKSITREEYFLLVSDIERRKKLDYSTIADIFAKMNSKDTDIQEEKSDVCDENNGE